MLKVSIIIPVYNVAPYIIRCLDSIYNQSYPNLEVIIIDDCGTDNSMAIIDSYLTSDQHDITRIIHHHKNQGLSIARNTGINNANGEYLYFIDSDDYITSNCINTLAELAYKYNYPTAIFGSAKLEPENWNDKASCITSNKTDIPEFSNDIKWIRKAFIKNNFLSTTAWNKLIKRDFIVKNGLYFKEGIIHEDILWKWMIGNHITSIAFNKTNTYYYCYSPTSITNMENPIKKHESEDIIIKELFLNINIRYLIPQFIHIFHFCHLTYYSRLKTSQLPPIHIRYINTIIFSIKCLFKKQKK